MFSYALNYFCDLICLEPCRICKKFCRPSSSGAKAICDDCWSELIRAEYIHQWRPLMGSKSMQIISRLYFKENVKTIIYKMKYDHDRLLGVDLARLLVDCFFQLMTTDACVLVPIPLHIDRQESRGFNQSELLASNLAFMCKLKTDASILTRVKKTLPQHGLRREERLNNLHGAFKGQSKKLVGKNVVLIDDVHTSGATLVEAANEILICGARTVSALTVASAPLYD